MKRLPLRRGVPGREASQIEIRWLKEKLGLSWQVVPAALGRYLNDPDRKKSDRAMQVTFVRTDRAA
jgi:predicted 3-demethylubiquinone-9 3-methyltransferase (glyoxalase superfamily)